MRDLLLRLFRGRYGAYGSDKLTRFLLIVAIIFFLISIVFDPLSFLYYIAFFALVFCYFRLFSKNITKRYRENKAFEAFLKKLTKPFTKS